MEILYEVAVDAPLATPLTYGHPAGRSKPVPVGACVQVPLANRQVTGFVLGLAPPVADPLQEGFTVKPITAILSDQPFFPENLVPLYRWIAGYYHHPIGEVVRTALPVAPGAKSSREVVLTESGKAQLAGQVEAKDTERFGDWLPLLLQNGRLESGTVGRLWRIAAARTFLKKLERQGFVAIRPIMHSSGSRPKTVAVLQPGTLLSQLRSNTPEASVDSLVLVLEQEFGYQLKKSERKVLSLVLAALTATRHKVSRKQLSEQYPGHGAPLQRLLQQGLLILDRERIYRDPFGDQPPFFPPPHQLSVEQQQVLAILLPAIANPSFTPFLLHGVTGCGKTEVYLQAVAHALDHNRTALVLVPEIALASQLEAHFYSRFGEMLAVLHSGLGDGERLDQWQRVMKREARVVLGARSAVFGPLMDLGVIIVDEEHEPAYKQDDGLRYNGRDLAVLRAQLSGCPVLLGSATPSVASYHNAQQHKYTLLTMEKRVENQPLPTVELVDLATVTKSRPDLVFSDRLITGIRETLERRQQSLLFVNRRGYASFMLCRDCGHILQCRHCQVSLTYHRSRNMLLCHYCGYSLHPKTICPACNSTRVTALGMGSERIEQEVQELFPEARVARLDSDTSLSRRQYIAVLKEVRAGRIDILIGTQMIAKGLHFPNITLVGVIWADSGLGMPDYKAAERTYALLSQVTGRAGRGEHPGRVIIQTYQPHHYAIEMPRHHQYKAFYQREIAVRQPLGYPPFSRLVNIKFSGIKEQQVRETAVATGAFLQELNTSNQVEILGPSPSPLIKLKDRTRWQLLLKSRYPTILHQLCDALIKQKSKICPQAVTLQIDVDPENMM